MSSTGQDYFRYHPRHDFTATNGFTVGLLLLCGDIETQPGPVASYSGMSELLESIKLIFFSRKQGRRITLRTGLITGAAEMEFLTV